MPLIKGIDHIALAVKDLEKALLFYTEVLGLTGVEIEEVPSQGMRAAFIEAGGVKIELMEPLDENSPVARWIKHHGPGLAHICFETEDIEALAVELKKRDLVTLGDITPGAAGRQVLFLHPKENSGALTEFAQPPRK
ncbi:MAG: methylmalonyl-CoA epimerase, partial [Thermodesulfobacteriota bacterium]